MSNISIPKWLKFLRCFDIDKHWGKTSYRFDWGEFSTSWRFLTIEYSVYHEEGTIRLGVIFGTLYLKAPMIINQRSGTEDWNACYGISFHDKGFWWHWRTKFWVWRPFGDWQHIRHDILSQPETHDYTYVLRNGTVQNRKATIQTEEREWRWKLFFILPLPKKVRRSIDINFDDEVGERTGSWKGGTLGCGYELLPTESPLQCLRRMEKERKFT